jgi:hypothetical protein
MRYRHRYFLLPANGRKEKRFGICCLIVRAPQPNTIETGVYSIDSKMSSGGLAATETMLKVNKIRWLRIDDTSESR